MFWRFIAAEDAEPFSMHERIPLKRALLWIFLSVMAVTGGATLGWLYYLHWIHVKQGDSAFNIEVIAQTYSPGERLETEYLAELLNLSKDRPVNLYSLNPRFAEEKLRSNPLIKKARVQKIKPGTVHIDYRIRKPAAYLGDYTNTAIDEEGVLIPFLPFFTPKKLPKFYLGEELTEVWGRRLCGEKYLLCQTLLDRFSALGMTVKSIDVSRIDLPSFAEREVIAHIEDSVEKDNAFVIVPMILRLSPHSCIRVLDDFSALWEREAKKIADTDENFIRQPVKIIDLRVDSLAFIMREGGDYD